MLVCESLGKDIIQQYYIVKELKGTVASFNTFCRCYCILATKSKWQEYLKNIILAELLDL